MMKKIGIGLLLIVSLVYGEKERIHIVSKGESLTGIAKKYNTSIKNIMEKNKIKDSNKIYTGMRLRIELLENLDKSIENIKNMQRLKSNKSLENHNITKDYSTYKVKKNDTLTKIANKYEMNMDELIEVNNIKNPNRISLNMKLKVYSDLGALAQKYEGFGDNTLVTNGMGLNFRIERSLNYYQIAKNIYLKEELDEVIGVNKKINGLENLKSALRFENFGNIYRIKGKNFLAGNYYGKSKEGFLKYQEVFKDIIPEVNKRLENIEKLMEEKNEK